MQEQPVKKLELLEQSPTVSKWGGARPNSGPKPKADTLKAVKKQFREYFTEEDIADVMFKVKAQMDNKPEILKLAVEQIFGKAPQSINMDMNAQVTISTLENSIKDLLYDTSRDQASEVGGDTLQDGRGEADGVDTQSAQDLSVDRAASEAASLASGLHATREILDGCLSGTDESE